MDPSPSPSPSPAPAPNGTLLSADVTKDPAYQNNISSIYAALYINIIIGAACLLGFFIFRTFMKQYQLRSVLNYVTIKPPPLPTTGLGRVFGWLGPVFATSDLWLLHSAGLDALVLQKSQALCLQVFLPVATLGCCFLMPLQLSESSRLGDNTFSRLTMANVLSGSKIMWAHWVCVFLFVGWTILLLEFHFKQYVSLRQFYLRGGDGWNYWRELHMAEADGVGVHEKSRFLEIVETARMDAIMKLMEKDDVTPQASWWRNMMSWLTSWTGTASAEDIVVLAKKLTAADANNPVIQKLRARTRSRGTIPSVGESTDAEGGTSMGGAGQPAAGSLSGTQPLGEGVEQGVAGNDVVASSGGAGGTSSAGATSPQQVQLEDKQVAGSIQGDNPGEEISNMAAPKWWSSVNVVTDESGKMRRMTLEEEEDTRGDRVLLAKPSVRYRKTVNTYDHAGRPVAVHAQQYAVLVTNVNQSVYPEYTKHLPPRGASTCGNPVVKDEDADVWMGERYRRFKDALDGPNAFKPRPEKHQAHPPKTTSILGGKGTESAVAAAEAVAALEAAEAGQGSCQWQHKEVVPVPPGRAAELWEHARAAMRQGRLKKLLHNEHYCMVSAVFSALFPYDFDRVVPVFNFREVDLLMRQWDQKLGELELAEQAVSLGAKRKMFKPKSSSEKVDRIDWLKGEVARLERAVLEARERAMVLNGTPSYFVLFRTQKSAAIAASCNIHPLKKELFKVHPAPGPEEVNWQALWFTHAQRVRRGFYATPFIIVLVMLPVSMLTSAMTQLNDLFCADTNAIRWNDYCFSKDPFYRTLKGLLTGFVPALLIQLWQGIAMPRFVFMAAQSEGRHYSLSNLDQRMASIYFLWACFNFFAGGVIGSTALSRIKDMVEKPFETPQLLGNTLPATAKFFFTYMILRTFMTIPLRFLITQPGVWQAWIRLGLRPFMKQMGDEGAAERTLFMRNAIRSPRYGVEYGGNTCLVVLICFAFAVICPLVPLFGVFFFGGMWLFWRYQLIYNYQRKYESGGQFFVFVADRIMISAAIMVAFTGCVMIVKGGFAQATLMWVFGLVAIYAYYVRTRELYVYGMREMPLLLAQMAPRARVPATVYVPPPLQQNGFMWNPEFNKVWEFFGMPGYSY